MPRHHALDLLRGLAALGITIYHFIYSIGIEDQSLGTFGVYVFFVLSGLTMMLVYGRQFSITTTAAGLQVFYWHRITRILPLLAVASVLSFALSAPSLGMSRHLGASALYALLTGTSLFALQLPGYLSNTIGAWSLGVETLFYLLFPIICLLIAKAGIARLAVVIAILICAQQAVIALMHHWVDSDPRRFWDYYTTFLTYLPFFLIGMLIYRSRLRTRLIYLSLSAASLVMICVFSLVIRVELFTTPPAYLALTAISVAVVLFAFAGQVPRNLVGTASTFSAI